MKHMELSIFCVLLYPGGASSLSFHFVLKKGNEAVGVPFLKSVAIDEQSEILCRKVQHSPLFPAAYPGEFLIGQVELFHAGS